MCSEYCVLVFTTALRMKCEWVHTTRLHRDLERWSVFWQCTHSKKTRQSIIVYYPFVHAKCMTRIAIWFLFPEFSRLLLLKSKLWQKLWHIIRLWRIQWWYQNVADTPDFTGTWRPSFDNVQWVLCSCPCNYIANEMWVSTYNTITSWFRKVKCILAVYPF
jgi:hypothetical protein